MPCSFRLVGFAGLLAAFAVAPLAHADDMKMSKPAAGMKMEMGTPAHFKPTREAYTTDHRFLVKLRSLPSPIPFEKHFSLRFAVHDGKAPHAKIADAKVRVEAGMRHGMEHGFAHTMESSPKVTTKDGEVRVSGMYFHMMGPWILEATVDSGGTQSVATFKLPCCGK